MKAPRALARFNKRVSNPIQMAWAPWLPPFAVVEHTWTQDRRRLPDTDLGLHQR
jgi:hypothetical protein